MRMSTSEKALLAACAGIYLAACVTAEAVAPTPKPVSFSADREKAVVTAFIDIRVQERERLLRQMGMQAV